MTNASSTSNATAKPEAALDVFSDALMNRTKYVASLKGRFETVSIGGRNSAAPHTSLAGAGRSMSAPPSVPIDARSST